jgi:hypothetical protein
MPEGGYGYDYDPDTVGLGDLRSRGITSPQLEEYRRRRAAGENVPPPAAGPGTVTPTPAPPEPPPVPPRRAGSRQGEEAEAARERDGRTAPDARRRSPRVLGRPVEPRPPEPAPPDTSPGGS